MCQFRTTLIGSGSRAGIDIPPEVIDELGPGNGPPSRSPSPGIRSPSTVAVMGGRFLIAVNAGTRKRTGLRAGDRTEVTVVLDTAPRTPTVPEDLAAAFAAAPGTSEAFARLSAGKQRRLIEHVLQAKAAGTRARRIERAVADLSPSPAA